MMTKHYVLILFGLVLLMSGCVEDVPSREEEQFVKIYGSAGDERAYDMLPLPDGGMLMLGSTTRLDTSGADRRQAIYLVWADEKGDVLQSMVVPSERNQVGKALLPRAEGFMVVAETQEAFSDKNDITIIRFSPSGDILNEKVVGYTSFDEKVGSVKSYTGGGYLIAGTTENVDTKEDGDPTTDLSDILLIRMSAGDEVIWTERYGFGGIDEGNSVVVSNDGNIYLAGTTDFQQGGRTGDNLLLYRINETGLETAVRVYGGNGNESISRIYQRQNQFYLVGSIGDGSQRETAIWRLSNTLDSLDVLSYGVSRRDEGVDMAFLPDGSYGVVSNALFTGSGTDLSYAVVSPTGATSSLQTFGANGNDEASRIFLGNDGKISLFGTMYFENTFKLTWIKPGVSTVDND